MAFEILKLWTGHSYFFKTRCVDEERMSPNMESDQISSRVYASNIPLIVRCMPQVQAMPDFEVQTGRAWGMEHF